MQSVQMPPCIGTRKTPPRSVSAIYGICRWIIYNLLCITFQWEPSNLIIQHPLQLIDMFTGFTVIYNIHQRIPIPPDLLPVICHDGSTKHRRGRRGHQQSHQQENYWWGCIAAWRASLNLLVVVLGLVLHVKRNGFVVFEVYLMASQVILIGLVV